MPDPLRRPGGLIFDLDGTLVDTVGARIDGWVHALADAGFSVSPHEIAPMIGMDGKRLATEVAAEHGRELNDDESEEIDKAAGAAFDQLNTSPVPLPGLSDVLEVAEREGIRWVIATSSRRAQVRASVEALALPEPPDIVDGSQVKHAKPAPDLMLLAAERLGLPPDPCWAVGDSTWDVRAAAAAGMAAIGVTAGSAVTEADLDEAGAALVVRKLTELAEVLQAAEA